MPLSLREPHSIASPSSGPTSPRGLLCLSGAFFIVFPLPEAAMRSGKGMGISTTISCTIDAMVWPDFW